MDFGRILAELRQEKAAIEQAILSIEKLAGAHRRGRPPGSGGEIGEEAPRKRGRPKGSKNRQPAQTANAAGGTQPV
jgi:hypothetical protein